ncbi:unnamed protein product [Pleuronectes platessa]|uniref:Uncharacterized protein n=1 Tax=Pleuronectes platessa TaxID=8262 RepID=A0A9N7U5I4_PLEPL|nr:unnamed protein product [Pleuronectes platessa]
MSCFHHSRSELELHSHCRQCGAGRKGKLGSRYRPACSQLSGVPRNGQIRVSPCEKEEKEEKEGQLEFLKIDSKRKPLPLSSDAGRAKSVQACMHFVEPKDLSSVCCWLWQPAVRGAQGESGAQVKGGPAADEDWSQRSLTPNEW